MGRICLSYLAIVLEDQTEAWSVLFRTLGSGWNLVDLEEREVEENNMESITKSDRTQKVSFQ